MAKEEKTFDAKAMIAEHSKKETKIRYGSRKTVEIIGENKYLKKGKRIRPHVIMADQMIKDGLAKEIKE